MENQIKQYSSIDLHFGSRGVYWWDIKLLWEPWTPDKLPEIEEIVVSKLKDIDNRLRKEFPNCAKPGVGKTFSFDQL